MKEQLITFETAKLAKEKGFNEYCYNYWIDENTQTDEHYIGKLVKEFKPIPAPTQSLLQKWLREVHGIILLVEDECHPEIWVFNIKTASINQHFAEKSYNTYEEALEIGLQEALKLIEL